MKIRCLKCNDIIESLSQHDHRYCKCGACSTDGGQEYTRIGGDLKDINLVYEDGTESPCINDIKKWDEYHFLGTTGEELIDIFDENNNSIGIVKEKQQAHEW